MKHYKLIVEGNVPSAYVDDVANPELLERIVPLLHLPLPDITVNGQVPEIAEKSLPSLDEMMATELATTANYRKAEIK